MTLRVVPEGLAVTSAAVEALMVRLVATRAAAFPRITAMVSSTADPVSVQIATAFSAQGQKHAVSTAQGAEELGRAGISVGETHASYEIGDVVAASTYGIAGD
ncbi:PE family protein [Mycobacterium uberis]|uniref:PE family protein n=1 Tax=Mycobacterium uberis TaxID=2162698 RepID=A0A3E1HE49_9MYCO|nr:PE family protein [Mycobacterium uberis]RFD24720.1 PE family protein [Mycobacterium uberis]